MRHQAKAHLISQGLLVLRKVTLPEDFELKNKKAEL